MVGFNLGINLKSTGMLAGRAPFTPSIAYPSNLARYDLNFVTQQYLNGIQPLTPNSDDGRFFRQQITPFTPMLSEQADGSILSQAYVGLRIGTSGMWVENDYGINSPILQNRDVSNAAWTKTNCTAAKTRTGRDNVTNAASIVTATAANAVFSQALTVAAGSYTVQVDLGTIAGSGIVEVSTDNFVTTTQITVNAPRYLGVGRYVTPRIAFGLNCTISFRLPSSGDSIHFDWAGGHK